MPRTHFSTNASSFSTSMIRPVREPFARFEIENGNGCARASRDFVRPLQNAFRWRIRCSRSRGVRASFGSIEFLAFSTFPPRRGVSGSTQAAESSVNIALNGAEMVVARPTSWRGPTLHSRRRCVRVPGTCNNMIVGDLSRGNSSRQYTHWRNFGRRRLGFNFLSNQITIRSTSSRLTSSRRRS